MDAPFQALIAATAAFVFITFLFGLLFLFCQRHRSKPHPLSAITTVPSAGAGAASASEETFSFDPSLSHISLCELSAATKNFSPESIIGDGAFGFVYLARLPTGATVAVKRLSADAFSAQGLRQFRAEIATLGRLHHANLTRILAFCSSGRDRLLVYEFLEKGSLDSWLHENSDQNESASPLTWQVRLKIVRGVAAGLAFLHEECKPPVIHRDIKASNVLLDGEFGARITDFGLARHVVGSCSHVSTQAAGTMGYMAPECRDGGTRATTKADVYSFGVLMLEVASGQRPSWPVREEGGKEISLVKWAQNKINEGRFREILDKRIEIREGREEEEVKGFMNVAYRCTEDAPRSRPSMHEAVSLLGQL